MGYTELLGLLCQEVVKTYGTQNALLETPVDHYTQ